MFVHSEGLDPQRDFHRGLVRNVFECRGNVAHSLPFAF